MNSIEIEFMGNILPSDTDIADLLRTNNIGLFTPVTFHLLHLINIEIENAAFNLVSISDY